MPNWCYINFTVSGPAKEISRFREAVRGVDDSGETAFDFNRLIPMPSELHDTTADGTAYEVYHGNPERILGRPWLKDLGIETVEQLRAKWNSCYAQVTENGDGSVHVQFDTAWTFPFPIFEKVAADFPTLIF